MTRFLIKRVYDPHAPDDGARILVDRLWPRGIAKDGARIDCWLRDIAPSDTLRKRFHGHSETWDSFCEVRYRTANARCAAAARKRHVIRCAVDSDSWDAVTAETPKAGARP